MSNAVLSLRKRKRRSKHRVNDNTKYKEIEAPLQKVDFKEKVKEIEAHLQKAGIKEKINDPEGASNKDDEKEDSSLLPKSKDIAVKELDSNLPNSKDIEVKELDSNLPNKKDIEVKDIEVNVADSNLLKSKEIVVVKDKEVVTLTKKEDDKKLFKSKKKDKSRYVDTYLKKGQVTEAIKELRTNLQFNVVYKNAKAILITSAFPKEGKSWISTNLAIAFAQNKKKTIVVDADMRKGIQAKSFSVPVDAGLSDLLSKMDNTDDLNSINYEDYIKKTEQNNLYVLTKGSKCPNPSELLSSDAMPKLLEKLKAMYDIIIFDGTPSNLVTDSVILCTLADLTVIVARYKMTKIETLKALKKSIEGVGGKIAGVVLNGVESKHSKYGYYKGDYSGYYGYGDQ